ncbi:uncharacterized protein LOC117296498 [Asterias rubens]|uniref:uncharacterized protein LOC117296498 n=1 Tax=Asterias rubens TaxID=7604 RepID=UPI001454EBBB|nr:uncharacterized protein LOC117296498 [Asterias rubens]
MFCAMQGLPFGAVLLLLMPKKRQSQTQLRRVPGIWPQEMQQLWQYWCAECNNAWYCNKECQTRDWKATHKKKCRGVKENIKTLATSLLRQKTFSRNAEAPYYFGNTLARDFLQLDNNEWSGEVVTEEDMARDYHVLSAGCGDLRDTVLTAGSLPDRYQGKLHVTLDDFDPFVMARNVLFLYMLVRFADTEGIESSLTTLWYSVHITKKEYDLIKTSLDELIQMDANSLHDTTKGLVTVSNKELGCLCQVWVKWRSFKCDRANSKCINLRKQRNALFKTEQVKSQKLPLFLELQSAKESKLMEKWFDHGMFLPKETQHKDMPFDNPTLTGRQDLAKKFGFFEVDELFKDPKDHTFEYCIRTDTFPFRVWDCLRVRESVLEPGSSPMVMFHNYVTSLLRKVKDIILQGRLYLHVSLVDCLQFHQYLESLDVMPKYDRIFTSNLADFLGFTNLLLLFKPLLNSDNSFSVIVTMTMNWIRFLPEANIVGLDKINPQVFKKCLNAYLAALERPTQLINYNFMREYFNNTSSFLEFLRADIMGGGFEIPPLKDVPSLTDVMRYNGMKMRDFRKEKNRLVPFINRVRAHALNMMDGQTTAVEWCLPHL